MAETLVTEAYNGNHEDLPLEDPHKETTLRGSRFQFNFSIGEAPITTRFYTLSQLGEEDLATKAVYAIGHASTFSKQSDEHYVELLHRIVNKGRSSEDRRSPEQVTEVLQKLVEDGYTRNGGSRYSLKPKAVELIKRGRFHGADGETESTEVEDPDTEKIFTNIKPAEFLPSTRAINKAITRKSFRSKKAILPEEMVAAKNTTYRTLEILGELEEADGMIQWTAKTLASEIRQRADSRVGGDSYKKPLERMEESGLVTIDNEAQTMELTEAGYQEIALLKAHSYHLKYETDPRMDVTVTLQIIEFIMEKTAALDFNPADPSYAETEHTDWFSAPNGERRIPFYLANVFKIGEKTMTRRLHNMRSVSKFVEIEDGKIRALRNGLVLYHKTRQNLRQKEEVLDEAAVEEVQETVTACAFLADSLGNEKLRTELEARYQQKHLFEYTGEEFEKEATKVRSMYKKLHRSLLEDQKAA